MNNKETDQILATEARHDAEAESHPNFVQRLRDAEVQEIETHPDNTQDPPPGVTEVNYGALGI